MGIDGFSLANLGLNKNLTSAQLANEAEAMAQRALDNQIADMDGVSKKEKAGRKDKDAAFNARMALITEEEKKEEENKENEQPEEPVKEEKPKSENNDEDDVSKYHFRFTEDNMIEVYDNEKQKVISKISAEDAAKILGNLSDSHGVIVNKKI